MKIGFKLLILILLVFPFSNSIGKTRSEIQIDKNKIAKKQLADSIKAESEIAMKNLEPYAGYYKCEDILKIFEVEKERIITELFRSYDQKDEKQIAPDSSIIGNYSEFDWNINNDSADVKVPSSKVLERNKSLGDTPDHFLYFQEYPHSQPRGGSCFDGDTPVLTLQCDNDNKDCRIEHTDMYDLYKDDYVLSSTLSVISDPRYQTDCWAWVRGVQVGKLHTSDGERFKVVTYKTSDESEVEVRVTPKHRFYMRASSKENWYWIRVGENNFVEGVVLYSDCKGGSCKVTKIYDSKYSQNYLQKFLEWIGLWSPRVFNPVVPDTFVYYVGPDEDHKILVHNKMF